MDDNAMQVHIEQRDDALILSPEGDIDMSRSPSLLASLRRAHDTKPGRLVVDLSHVSYMDSSGVATLVDALKTSRANNTRLTLCGMNDRVHSIFEIARLDTVFDIVPDLDTALDT